MKAVRRGHGGPDPASWLSSHLVSSHILQVRLLLPGHETRLRWGGPAVPAAATVQTQVSLGLWQAGVRGDELPQALRGEEESVVLVAREAKTCPRVCVPRAQHTAQRE